MPASTALYQQTVTVTRLTESGTDAYGNPTGTWNTFWTGLGRAEPMTGEERLEDRETQWHRLKVFLPPAAAGVLDSDRISIDGSPDWNIEQVQEWPNPLTSGVHHLEVRVRQEV